jgi:HEPN domain-containing protein
MRRDPTDPHTWLAQTRSNLRRAELGRQDTVIFFEDLCFDAQQAAEKSLKALCLHRGIEIQKTHSLVILLDLLEGVGLTIPPEVKEADELTRYAVGTRYPGLEEEVDEEEYGVALRQARAVVEWVERILNG